MSKDNNIPASIAERTRLRGLIADFTEGKHIVPPVPLHALEAMANEFVTTHAIDSTLRNWLMVEIHNCVWQSTVAAIPYDRRLLLLPKCLSHSSQCEGEMDEIGLLCHSCGKCCIPNLQERADEMGMLSMVAEGFTSVIELIENQVVDAVVGVSCLESLEKAFPLLVSHAVPGLAIPLNKNGCKDTTVDAKYVAEMMSRHSDTEIRLLNFDRVKDQVSAWFTVPMLAEVWDTKGDKVQQIAFEWLAGNGKRWRPFLLASVYQALTGAETLPDEVRKACIAIECFHKASLVHDDIQDGDTTRYGMPTVNALYGDAIAINIGDLLLGEGYKLLASCLHKELVSAIAEAHISLCMGQGAELAWTAQPTPLTIDFVLDIFKNKTVPAFEMALTLGLICADQGGSMTREVLTAYSEALGIAYQLKDDIEDYTQDNIVCHRPSAIKALMEEHDDWTAEQVTDEVRRLMERYHQEALNVLSKIDNIELKRLLFQVTEKIMKQR